MKARIDIKYEPQTVQEETKKKSLFGYKTIITPVTYDVYALYLYLEITEEEKAIIKINRLDEIVLEERKIDMSESDEETERVKSAALANATGETHRRMIEQIYTKAEPVVFKTKLSEYLGNPSRFSMGSVLVANEYAAKLKTKILPRIKEILTANYQVGPTSETFEF